MSSKVNNTLSAIGFFMLMAMMVASYTVTSGTLTAMVNGGAQPTAVASSKSAPSGS